MNAYEEKQAARKDRMADHAAKLRAEARRIDANTRQQLSFIPFGQPILVGHHSERKHRNTIERAHRNTTKVFDLFDRAAELERRANSESRAISSDDQDAVAKLQTKLANLEAAQVKMVAANKAIRKNDRAGLAALGFTEEQIDGLFKPDFAGRVGFPAYALTNNNGVIRATKTRIDELSKLAAKREAVATGEASPAAPVAFDGGRMVEDLDDNRLCLIFDGKPATAIITTLKSNGFKWSPSRGAWVRMLNNAARYAAACVIRTI